jgi:hypothetical protein
MRKTGVGFDLAIALALLATDEQIAHEPLGQYVAWRTCFHSGVTP